jgi:hypothetical protein
MSTFRSDTSPAPGDHRLSINVEHLLEKKVDAEAYKACSDVVRQMAECATREGLLVVFKCREENSSMRKCLKSYPSKQRMEELRANWRRDHPRPEGQFWDSAAGVKSSLADDVRVSSRAPQALYICSHAAALLLTPL